VFAAASKHNDSCKEIAMSDGNSTPSSSLVQSQDEKTCFKCGITKPLSSFYRHAAMADGHLGKCKECTKKDTKSNYRLKIDQYHEYDKKRGQDPERKKKMVEYSRSKRKRYPLKYAAWREVQGALIKGVLIRMPCEVCGHNVVEAHHDDYSKPLEVKWLCRRHHKILHGKLVSEI